MAIVTPCCDAPWSDLYCRMERRANVGRCPVHDGHARLGRALWFPDLARTPALLGEEVEFVLADAG